MARMQIPTTTIAAARRHRATSAGGGSRRSAEAADARRYLVLLKPAAVLLLAASVVVVNVVVAASFSPPPPPRPFRHCSRHRQEGGSRHRRRGTTRHLQEGTRPSKATATDAAGSASSAVQSDAPGTSTSAQPQHRHYDHDAWAKGWETVQEERCYELEAEEEEEAGFPDDLVGTFYQNGPGKFQVGNRPDLILHPFDGDGMVRAVTFFGDNGNGDGNVEGNNKKNDNKAWFRNRYVRTPGYVEELEKGEVRYRGVFGTRKYRNNFLDLRIKNVANTHVMRHGDRLFALWEAGKPIEIDPVTLETKADDASWTDALFGKKDKYGSRYAAHYKVDPRNRTLCNFCIYFSWPDPNAAHRLEIMEHALDGGDDGGKEAGGELLYRHVHELPGLAVGHDSAVTPSYFAFIRSTNSIRFDPLDFVMGRKGPAQCFAWDDNPDGKGAHLHLVPRGAVRQEPITVDIPSCFCFHMVNAYEDESTGDVVIDAIVADRMVMADTTGGDMVQNDKDRPRPIWETIDFAEDLPPYRMVSYRVDADRRELVSLESLGTDAVTASVDFPAIHPDRVGSEYRYAYACACSEKARAGPLQGVVKVDVQRGAVVDRWMPPPHQFLSEVVVAPRRRGKVAASAPAEEEEDRVYLVGYLLDGKAERSSVVVFDAQNLSRGPISQAPLRQVMPHSLHGIFLPDFTPALSEEVQETFGS